MLSCSDCLARYSDYLDGLMDADNAERWRSHLSTCPDCGRYDRILRRGLKLLVQQPRVELSEDFQLRLDQRLTREAHKVHVRPFTSMTASSLAVAAMLAFAAWIPVLMLSQENTSSAIAASQPPSAVATEIAWHRESAVDQRSHGHVHFARRLAWAPTSSGHVIEAKYTPVVLESPIAPPSYARPHSYYGE